MSNGLLIVGEPNACDVKNNSGAVYIYQLDIQSGYWILQERIKSWDFETNDQFGSVVNIYSVDNRHYTVVRVIIME